MVVMFTMWCCVTASKAAKKAARVENTEVSASHYICAWATHCNGVLWSSSSALFFNWLTGFRVSLSLHQYSLWTRPIHSLRQHYISLSLTHTEGKSDRCTSARTASQPNVNLAREPEKSHQALKQAAFEKEEREYLRGEEAWRAIRSLSRNFTSPFQTFTDMNRTLQQEPVMDFWIGVPEWALPWQRAPHPVSTRRQTGCALPGWERTTAIKNERILRMR